MYQVKREKLEAELVDRHVGLTSDIWTSAATQGYITVTAYLISDGWELCSQVLLTREMGEHHTGVNISERLLEAAKEWSTIYCKSFNVEKFRGFRGSISNRETFPVK